MGLLDKATRFQSDVQAPVTGRRREGLLKRAERLRSGQSAGQGLFERARALREQATRSGLFHRAEQLRASEEAVAEPGLEPEFLNEEEQSVTLTAEELADLQGPLSPPTAEEAPLEEPLEATIEEPSPNEQVEEVALPEEPAKEPEMGAGQEQTTEESTELSDWPEFPFEERSPEEDDPALSEDQIETDPFEQWEEEAAREAEEKGRELLGETDLSQQFFEDEEIMTTPMETHIGSQKRIDNFLALFELNRELHSIEDAEEFWDTALYAILGQIGARSVVIFAGIDDRKDILYPVAHSGVIPEEDWNLKAGDEIYDTLAASEEIRYAGQFLKDTSGISDLERRILETSRASVLMPLRQGKDTVGAILVGPPLDRADYVIDDLEYLRLLGGSLIGPLERINNIKKHKEETETLVRQNVLHRSLADLAASLQTKKAVDEIYDVLLDYFRKNLKVDSLSLVLLDPSEQAYKIFAGNRISPESLKRFHLSVSDSELVGTISNLSGVYNLVDFRTHPEIIAAYSGDDLALMQHYWILPLINLNWLVGFITVHHTERAWTEEEREIALVACAQLAPVLANCLILQERETLFRDPFSPLEKRLEREVQKALEFHSFLSIVDFRVRNLKKVLGANSMSVMSEYFQALSRTLSRSLHHTDYMSRMGAGRYVLLLPGRGKAEAEIFSERLQMELKQANLLRGSAVAPAYAFDVIAFPDDGDSLQKLIALLDR